MSDQLDFIIRHIPNLLWGFPNHRPGGLLLSLILSSTAIATGLVLAIGLGFATHSRYRVVRLVAGWIIWAVRGIPLIVLLVLLFQFLGTGSLFGINFSAYWSAFVTLTLYAAAYQADIVSAGIAAVPQQLLDDARLLGASRFTTERTVTLPHSLRTMRPALTTQAITIFKDSSVVVVLSVAELTTTAEFVLGSNISNAPYWMSTYLVVGFLYWIVAFGIAQFIEHRGHHPAMRLRGAHG